MNWVSTGSDNGLSPVRRQAITWANAHLLSIGPLGTNCREIRIKTQKHFIQENVFENVLGETAFILSRGRWVKSNQSWSWVNIVGTLYSRCSLWLPFLIVILLNSFGWYYDTRGKHNGDSDTFMGTLNTVFVKVSVRTKCIGFYRDGYSYNCVLYIMVNDVVDFYLLRYLSAESYQIGVDSLQRNQLHPSSYPTNE